MQTHNWVAKITGGSALHPIPEEFEVVNGHAEQDHWVGVPAALVPNLLIQRIQIQAIAYLRFMFGSLVPAL